MYYYKYIYIYIDIYLFNFLEKNIGSRVISGIFLHIPPLFLNCHLSFVIARLFFPSCFFLLSFFLCTFAHNSPIIKTKT